MCGGGGGMLERLEGERGKRSEKKKNACKCMCDVCACVKPPFMCSGQCV